MACSKFPAVLQVAAHPSVVPLACVTVVQMPEVYEVCLVCRLKKQKLPWTQLMDAALVAAHTQCGATPADVVAACHTVPLHPDMLQVHGMACLFHLARYEVHEVRFIVPVQQSLQGQVWWVVPTFLGMIAQAVRDAAQVSGCALIILSDANTVFISEVLQTHDLQVSLGLPAGCSMHRRARHAHSPGG